jgi:hypothetical protein
LAAATFRKLPQLLAQACYVEGANHNPLLD